jgi:hypothetical protein
MDPRAVLRGVIRRLASKVGEVQEIDFTWWEDDKAAAVAGRPGRPALAEALLEARQALASGDKARVETAALICPMLERTGHEQAIASRTRAGGQLQGQRQTQDAAAAWIRYVAGYRDLRARGKTATAARQIIVKSMERDGFKLPSTGSFPDARTIRKRLPAKIK